MQDTIIGGYTEMEPLGPQDAADAGGDAQISAAYSRRFVRDLGDGTFAVITLQTYVVDTQGDPDQPARPVLTHDFEYTVCTDPADMDNPANQSYTGAQDLPPVTTDEEVRAACAAFDPATLTWAGQPHPTSP